MIHIYTYIYIYKKVLLPFSNVFILKYILQIMCTIHILLHFYTLTLIDFERSSGYDVLIPQTSVALEGPNGVLRGLDNHFTAEGRGATTRPTPES